MTIEQIYTGCLAQGAYYITSNGEAVIIDPLRETAPYVDRIKRDNVNLKYIFETHFHADFVSGHLNLSKATGAPIVFGPNAKPSFEFISAKDNEVFSVGELTIKAIHTPGHTLESTCYLLSDISGKELALFSGDTLFLGDVGRPDLAQKTNDLTQEDLAGLLFDSLTEKIIPLSDEVIVYPAHGAGSACGKNMMKETIDTLGNQKRMNYALNQPSKEAFIEAVTDGLTPPPSYFGMNVSLNKYGYLDQPTILNNAMNAFSIVDFIALADKTGALLLDTRSPALFWKGFVPKSINIGLNGDFAPWVGAMVSDVNQPILLINEPGHEIEAITRLSRVGFDQVIGYLAGGFETWKSAGQEIDHIRRINAETFEKEVSIETDIVIDVRKETEYASEHLNEAYNKPLAYINDWISQINPDSYFFLHCAGGYRSMIAASILQARGIRNFTEIEGGFGAIKKTNLSVTDFICETKKY